MIDTGTVKIIIIGKTIGRTIVDKSTKFALNPTNPIKIINNIAFTKNIDAVDIVFFKEKFATIFLFGSNT